jgi:intracellular sulfur oxidation DsrE/DsrF family protein
MKSIARRSLSTWLAGALVAAWGPGAYGADPAAAAPGGSGYVKPDVKHEAYGEVRVVVPLTTDNQGIQAMKIRNITNAVKAADAWGGKLRVKVVLYAKGVTLLKNPDETVRARLDMLRSHGVQFEVCNNTLSEQGIDFHTLYGVTDGDIVPSGFLEVGYLQYAQHYAVDPVN